MGRAWKSLSKEAWIQFCRQLKSPQGLQVDVRAAVRPTRSMVRGYSRLRTGDYSLAGGVGGN